ncbi:MAG: hypothetical protein ABI537_07905 [Casimicrobiaceae bacterium]
MDVAFNYRETGGETPLPPLGSDEARGSSLAGAPRFDVCPTWLELATRHLSDAGAAQMSRVAEGSREDGFADIGTLEWEYQASLQAIVACGTAVHAFGAAIQSKVQLPQSVHDDWQRHGTPRYFQISDVLRRAFALSQKNASGVRQCVGEILRFHDLAIDPSQKSGASVFHPELGAAVEWRFAYFRYENALQIVQATMRLIGELVALGKPYEVEVQKYVDGLRSKVELLQNSGVLKAPRVGP